MEELLNIYSLKRINMDKSYFPRERSEALKGFLMLLIILGHNGLLMGTFTGMEKLPVYDYLYTFHVYAFLILPFLYGEKKFTWESTLKTFKKLYIPYTIFFVLLLLVNIIRVKAVGGGYTPTFRVRSLC